jgi:hypothetical protein
MRLDSSGRLLVGTTTVGDNSKLTVVNSGNTTCSFQQSTAGFSCAEVVNTGTASVGANSYFFSFRQSSSGSNIGSITYNNTNILYNNTSDYRLKTVVGSVVNAGERLDALEPIEYDWNNGSRTRGFLAHKFAEIYPNSVCGEKDAVDANGKPLYQAMQASSPEVMADLIAEIQSLRKRVAQLESK